MDRGAPDRSLLGWYDVRDAFFAGEDLSLVLEKARKCVHPDAVWLLETLKDRPLVRDRFLFAHCQDQNDPRVLCFSAVCDGFWNIRKWKQAADSGYPFAQAKLVQHVQPSEALSLAQKSAAANEREGLYALALLYAQGKVVPTDVEMAKACFERAIVLGHGWAAAHMASFSPRFSLECIKYWCLAARSGFCSSDIASSLSNHNVMANRSCVFVLGAAVKFLINSSEKRALFRETFKNVANALVAVAFFETQVGAARAAVDEWTKVAIRLGIIRDVRKLIAKLVWDAREKANY